MCCRLKQGIVDLPDVPGVSFGHSSSRVTLARLGLKMFLVAVYQAAAASWEALSDTWVRFMSSVPQRGGPRPCPGLRAHQPGAAHPLWHVSTGWCGAARCWGDVARWLGVLGDMSRWPRVKLPCSTQRCIPGFDLTGRGWGCGCVNIIRSLHSDCECL